MLKGPCRKISCKYHRMGGMFTGCGRENINQTLCPIRNMKKDWKFNISIRECELCGKGFFIFYSSKRSNGSMNRVRCYSEDCRKEYFRRRMRQLQRNKKEEDVKINEAFFAKAKLENSKFRSCLGHCGKMFWSSWSGHRICDTCSLVAKAYHFTEFDWGGGHDYDF